MTAEAGGPPLVLLHGVGTSAGEWARVLPALARNNLVYAPDLTGYDGSGEPPDYYSPSGLHHALRRVVSRAVSAEPVLEARVYLRGADWGSRGRYLRDAPLAVLGKG